MFDYWIEPALTSDGGTRDNQYGRTNMRKVVAGTFVTLDGVMQAPGGLKYGEVEVGLETVIFE